MDFTKNGLVVIVAVVFAAGAGTAYAGMVLPTITLGGDVVIIGDAELEGKLLDTNDEAGTSGQVLSSTETGLDWIDSTGLQGATGATGATGMTGMTGMTGPSEITLVSIYGSSSQFISSDETDSLSLTCPFSTESVVSGGIEEIGFITEDFFIGESYPLNSNTWATRVENNSPFLIEYELWIVCLDIIPAASSSGMDATTSESRTGIVLEPEQISQNKEIRKN